MTFSRAALAVSILTAMLGAADASATRQRNHRPGHQARPRIATYAVPARPARVLRTAQGARHARAS